MFTYHYPTVDAHCPIRTSYILLVSCNAYIHHPASILFNHTSVSYESPTTDDKYTGNRN